MKVFKRILLGLIMLIAALWLLLVISGNGHIIAGLRSTYFIGKSAPDIDDLNLSKYNIIKTASPVAWPEDIDKEARIIPEEMLQSMMDFETTAFLVVKDDTLQYEAYWQGYHKDSVSNIFSMAKSITSLLIGSAMQEGYLKDERQLIAELIPEYNNEKSRQLNLEHLLQMTSGIPFGESYSSPFGYQAKAYFGNDLKAITLPYAPEIEPGSLWKYEGGNTVLLGVGLSNAIGLSASAYIQEAIWKKSHMEHDAYWATDGSGQHEKYFSAFYSTARDIARLGKLILDGGVIEGQRVLSERYMERAFQPCMVKDDTGEAVEYYGYQWWLSSYEGKAILSARGIRGQYLLMIPEDELIVVRFGRKRSEVKKNHMPEDAFIYLDAAYQLLK